MKNKKIYQKYFSKLLKKEFIENDKLYQYILQFQYAKSTNSLTQEEILTYILLILDKNILLLDFSSILKDILSWNNQQFSEFLIPFFEIIMHNAKIYGNFNIYIYFDIFFKQGFFFSNEWLKKQLVFIGREDLLEEYSSLNIQNYQLFLKHQLHQHETEENLKKI
jgi:hypothetical protein